MRLTAQDLKKLAVIDDIVPEPLGAAHRAHDVALTGLGDAVEAALQDLVRVDPGTLRAQRREKFVAMGKIGLT